MKLLKIIQHPHKTLRKKAEAVSMDTLKSKQFQEFLDNLMATLVDKSPFAAGLSANQVNKLHRVFVVNMEFEDGIEMKQFLINPEIIETSKEMDVDWEGCLSFNGPEDTPDQWGKVKRSNNIKVKCLDRDGNTLTFTAKDFYARLILHEIDHLNGVLFIDKLASKLLNTEELEEILGGEENRSIAG